MTADQFVGVLHAWQSFYLLVGGAAATLTGLMFVAVTFGAPLLKPQNETVARAFIDPTVTQFLQVLLTACVMVVPELGARTLGGLLLVGCAVRVAGLAWVYRQLRVAHATNGDLEWSDWLSAIVLPGLAYALMGASGVGFVLGRREAFAALAVVNAGLLAVGVWSAWGILLWMAIAANVRGPTDHDGSAGARPDAGGEGATKTGLR